MYGKFLILLLIAGCSAHYIDYKKEFPFLLRIDYVEKTDSALSAEIGIKSEKAFRTFKFRIYTYDLRESPIDRMKLWYLLTAQNIDEEGVGHYQVSQHPFKIEFFKGELLKKKFIDWQMDGEVDDTQTY